MAQANVKLTVEARSAISSLNKTSLASKKLSLATKGTTTSLTTASAAAKGFGASLMASLGPIIAVGGAFATVNNALRTFSDRERDVAILKQGLVNLGQGTEALNKLQEAASKLGNETLFDQEEFTRGFNLLTSFRKIGVDSYGRVAQAAADIAQVNQVDVNTSFMQLAKALQDPERNLSALNRSGIAFTKTQTDVIKELMKANKEAEAHAMILDIVDESYNKLAQAGATGLAGDVDSLGEAFRDFSEILGKELQPVLSASVKGLTELIKAATSPLGKTAAIFTGIALAVKGATATFVALKVAILAAGGAAAVLTIALNAIPFVALATGAGLLTTALIKANDEKKKFNDLINKGDEKAVTQALKDQAKVVGELQRQYDEGGNKERKALRAKKEEAELQLKMLEGRFQTIQSDKKIEEAQNKIVALKKKDLELTRLTKEEREKHKKIAKDEADRIKKEEERKKKAFADFIAKQEQSGELLQAAIDGNVEEVRLQQAINDAVAKHGEHNRQKITDQLTANQALRDQKTEIDKNAEAAEALKNKFNQIGQEIKDGIVQNLTDAVMGTQTLAESAINVLERLRRKLIEVAIQKALAGLGGMFGGGFGGFLGGLFGRANGGRVSANQPYMVGERGREVFVPTTSGTIVPNNQLGGGSTNVINVSVDASGTEAEGDEDTSSQLGKLIGLAVQEELVKQQRAGGLLSRA